VRRREFIKVIAGSAAWPLAARAQQPALPVIGFVNSAPRQGFEPQVAAFLKGLGEAGYVDGRNVTIEYRWAEGQYDRLPVMVADLVQRQVAVIVANTPGNLVAKAATKSIPIVFVTVSDAVGGGFVSNLAHPGGNITGFQNFEAGIGGKWVDLLREIAPHVLRVGFLYTPEIAAHALFMREIEESCSSSGLSAFAAGVQNASEIDPALSHFAREPNGGMIVAPSPLNTTNRRSIIQRATDLKIPTVYPFRYFCRDGGLASYGFEPAEQHRAAASYVSRILNGEKPGDLPVQAPSRYELVINLKAAKAIGLSISSGLQLLAAEVIE